MQTPEQMTRIKTRLAEVNQDAFNLVASFDHSTRLINQGKRYSLVEVQLKGVLALEHDDSKAVQVRRYISYNTLQTYEVV